MLLDCARTNCVITVVVYFKVQFHRFFWTHSELTDTCPTLIWDSASQKRKRKLTNHRMAAFDRRRYRDFLLSSSSSSSETTLRETQPESRTDSSIYGDQALLFFIPECDTINTDYCHEPGSQVQRVFFFLIRTRSEGIGVAFHEPLSWNRKCCGYEMDNILEPTDWGRRKPAWRFIAISRAVRIGDRRYRKALA